MSDNVIKLLTVEDVEALGAELLTAAHFPGPVNIPISGDRVLTVRFIDGKFWLRVEE